ncbi:hypothetical protein HanRHA438_Chr04g0194681 [Helianthus annuus]|nr:hypothetical protein HanRHA438_Chr04g0194681 [Helianthus annuus]
MEFLPPLSHASHNAASGWCFCVVFHTSNPYGLMRNTCNRNVKSNQSSSQTAKLVQSNQSSSQTAKLVQSNQSSSQTAKLVHTVTFPF